MKPLPAPANRLAYRASGRAHWFSFLVASSGVLLLAMAMAWLLWLLGTWGFHWVIITPLLLSLPVAGALYVTVQATHCRNRWAATAVGLLAGLLISLGHYQVELAMTFGPQTLGRLDMGARWINFAMNTQVLKDARDRDDGPPPGGPTLFHIGFNWLFLVMEVIFRAGLIAAIGRGAQNKAYAEGQQTWMTGSSAQIAVSGGEEIAAALTEGSLTHLKLALAPAANINAGFCELTLEYAPGLAPNTVAEGEDPVYLSARAYGPANAQGARKIRHVFQQWSVTPQELAVLQPLFPNLALASASAPMSTRAPATGAEQSLDKVATITLIPEPLGGTVLTPRTKILGTFFALMPLALGLGSAGVALVYIRIAENAGEEPSLPLMAGLGIHMFFWLGLGVTHVDFLNSRMARWYLLSAIRQRPDAVVTEEDTDAMLVEYLPREAWGKVTLKPVSDVGLVRVDRERRCLLYEGDRQRWEVPAAAITSWAEEPVARPEQQGQGVAFQATVLRFQTTNGIFEGPLVGRHTHLWKFGGSQRRQIALQLMMQLAEIQRGVAKS